MKRFFLFAIFFIFVGCSNQDKIEKSLKSSSITHNKSSSIKREALIINVDEYYEERLKGLNRDINNISKILRKWHFNITNLTNSEALMVIDKLKKYESLKPDDIFIFYFTGNGFHVPDRSKDESDGEDSAIAFSDSRRNFLFLDDSLFGYLNRIKAKKLIILDTSYNRGDFVDPNGIVQPKALFDGSQYQILKTDSFKPEESVLNGGTYIMFESSKDGELSYTTSRGSLFTNALVKSIESGGSSKSILDLESDIENILVESYNRVGYMQHPNFSFSNPELENISLKDFLSIKSK